MPWYEISYSVEGRRFRGFKQDPEEDVEKAFMHFRDKARQSAHPLAASCFDCKRLSNMSPIVVAIKLGNVPGYEDIEIVVEKPDRKDDRFKDKIP